MKKIHLLLVFIGIAYGLSAQITITKSDVPKAKDTARYSTAVSLYNFTNTGANYTWNYPLLITTGQAIDSFKSPLSISPFFLLPFGLTDYGVTSTNTINFNLLNLTKAYDFYKPSNSSLEVNGIGAIYSGLPIPFLYTTPDKVYQFPLTYGRIDTSTYDLTISVPAVGSVHQRGTRINNVDGWGTVITPFDTFQCLRLKSIVTEIDSITIGTGTTSIGIPVNTTTYKWLAHGSVIPVLEVQGMELFNTFVPTTIKFKDHIRASTPLYNLSVDFTANKTVCTTLDTVTISPTLNPFYALNPNYQYSIYPNTFNYLNGTDSNSKKPQVNFTMPGLYTVSLFAQASAFTANTTADTTKIDYILVTQPATGISQPDVQEPVNVYPVPANQYLYCHLTGNAAKQVTLELYDIAGRLLVSIAAPQNGDINIPTADIATGSYIFRATPLGGTPYQRIVNVVH